MRLSPRLAGKGSGIRSRTKQTFALYDLTWCLEHVVKCQVHLSKSGVKASTAHHYLYTYTGVIADLYIQSHRPSPPAVPAIWRKSFCSHGSARLVSALPLLVRLRKGPLCGSQSPATWLYCWLPSHDAWRSKDLGSLDGHCAACAGRLLVLSLDFTPRSIRVWPGWKEADKWR